MFGDTQRAKASKSRKEGTMGGSVINDGEVQDVYNTRAVEREKKACRGV